MAERDWAFPQEKRAKAQSRTQGRPAAADAGSAIWLLDGVLTYQYRRSCLSVVPRQLLSEKASGNHGAEGGRNGQVESQIIEPSCGAC